MLCVTFFTEDGSSVILIVRLFFIPVSCKLLILSSLDPGLAAAEAACLWSAAEGKCHCAALPVISIEVPMCLLVD